MNIYDANGNIIPIGGGEVNHWQGKKWLALGTSITDYGKYTDALKTISGMVLTEAGNAGGSITNNGAVYQTIMSRDYTGYDLVTLEGFVNDWHGNVTLGNVGDTTTSTFCGALCLALEHIRANSTARIVCITDQNTKATASFPNFGLYAKNSNNNTEIDFREKIIAVCNSLSIPVILVGEESGVSPLTDAYYSDQIHPTNLGGQVMAEYIWSKLKNVPLWKT